MSGGSEIHLITGKWASGKTYACALLGAGRAARGVRFISDRTALEDGVLFDHGKAHPQAEATRTPQFSDVSHWGRRGDMQFTVRDGFLYHVARTEIVRVMKAHLAEGEGVLVVEVAIGPEVARREGRYGAFAQTTEDLVQRLEDADVRGEGRLRFVQIEAPLEERLHRQGVRSDATARHAFELYAGDGGELVRHRGDRALIDRLQALGWQVQVIDNGGVPREHVAHALDVPPLGPDDARAAYDRLLGTAVITLPPHAFHGYSWAPTR